MATKFLKLRALATLVAFGSLLPVACDGDDDTNPAPSTGGTGAKGGTGGKGGTAGKGGTSGSSGQAGDNGSGGSTGGTGAKGGAGGSTGGTGAKGGTGGKGGSGAKGGTGNVGGEDNGGMGGETPQPSNECTDLVESNDYPAPCYDDCTPAKTDDSEQFLNRCSDGSQTLGGVKSDCTPWVGKLNALGDGCTKLGDGCVLPDLP